MIALATALRKRARVDFYGRLLREAKLDRTAELDSTLPELLLGEGTVTGVTSDSFIVSVALRRYAEAYLYSWTQLYRRAESQRSVLEHLRGHAPLAWRLVTSYYLSFFSSGMIRTASGRVTIALDDDDSAQLLRKSAIGSPKLDSGMYFGRAEFSDFDNSIVVKMRFGGEKPHRAAWTQFVQVAGGALDDADEASRALVDRLREDVRAGRSPSDIRNKWNYSEPLLYGPRGEETSKRFDSLAPGTGNVKEWLTRRQPPASDLSAEFIAVLTSVLWRTVELMNDEHVVR